AKSLFTPLAMAVVFAMLASYLLTRTLVPTLVKYMVRGEVHLYQNEGEGHSDHSARKADDRRQAAPRGNIIWRISKRFERLFERMREKYKTALGLALNHPRATCIVFALFCAGSLALYPFLGQDFFPTVDAGQFRLHVRAPAGTRLEETEQRFAQ